MNQGKKNIKDELFLVGKVDLSDSQIAKRKKGDWVEDSFINYNNDELSQSNKNYLGLLLNSRFLGWSLSVIFFVMALLFTRAIYLQVFNGEQYLQLAENNRLRLYHLQSPRGIIYDARGVALVKNIPNFSLYLIPVDFPKDAVEQETVFETLRPVFDADTPETLAKILKITPSQKEYYQPQLLINHLDYEMALKFKIKSLDLPGISVDVNNQRQYLMALAETKNPLLHNSLAHLLGYVGKVSETEYAELEKKGYLYSDFVGKIGLEKYYESALRGKYGKRQVEVDSLGKEKKVIAEEAVQKGDNLVLTIDSEVQLKLEELLREVMAKKKLTRAVAIVENPNNGELIAMVSLPSYDNNLFAKGIGASEYQTLLTDESKPLFNRAISGEYPSGSVIKPVFAAAALEEKIITAQTTFLSAGGIRIDRWFFPDWAAGGHGLTNVYRALAWSVNTFFYIIGGGYEDFEGLGVYRLNEYGKKFGLASKTGIDLAGERPGFLPTPEWKQEVKNEQWYIGDTYHMAIGQGDVLVTPLQVSNYMSVFANRGTLYRPRLLKSVIKASSNETVEVLPEVINSNFIDKKNIDIVRQGMRQTVTLGSAKMLSGLPVSVAGKTGTAQWGTNKETHAWFTCFAPYENPEITLTILFEEGGEGSVVAVPVAADFLAWYFSR